MFVCDIDMETGVHLHVDGTGVVVGFKPLPLIVLSERYIHAQW